MVEQSDFPLGIEPDKPLDEAGHSRETIATNTNLETEHMEVHHHAHHGGKKSWKTYFWEFLMLFLAVFCGFLAEYQLEHTIEHQREKQYIRSLIADLKADQEILSRHITHLQAGISMMDSMIGLLNDPTQVSANTGKIYYFARVGPRLNPLSNNNRTFEQLKNSGNFRLIRNLNTSNRIMVYYERFPMIRLLESINENEFNDYKRIAAKVLDPSVLVQMEDRNNRITRTNENPRLVTTEKQLLQELSVFSVYINGTKKGILTTDNALKETGAELIEYLQKEYELE